MYTTFFFADMRFSVCFFAEWYTLVYMSTFFHVYHFIKADSCFFSLVYMVYMKTAILYIYSKI